MATKSKRPKDPETQHLSDLQISEIPHIVWEFLVTETGKQETALHLPPKKLRDYAGDFLDSEEGRFYWPLSDFQQWQYEATHGDVKKWIGELMVRERKRRDVATSTLAIDDRHAGSGKKKEKGKAPVEGPNALQKKESSSASRVRVGERVRGAATAEAPSKKDPVTPTKRAKSPTVVPDVPYEETAEPCLSTPKRSIRPTEAAVLIAGQRNKSQDKCVSDSVSKSAGRSATLGLGLSRSPTTPRKRPVEAEAVGGTSPTSFASREDRSNKKVALSPSAPMQGPSSPQPSFFALSDLSTTAKPPDEVNMPPPHGEPNRAPNHAGPEASVVSSATITAIGLQFSVDQLAKLPERVLEYITECVHHQIRLANKADNARLKDGHRAQSTLLQKLHADLESRIKCLAEDAERKQRVESSHCLWKE